MAKQTQGFAISTAEVRTRRAYFDCRFGQLHVRTAFPITGGFDEGVTLVCLHSREGSSRVFASFLPRIAQKRSVYAPDLPGFGESDPAPTLDHENAARAVSDLANDLRLRQIDVFGVGLGAAVALDLAASRPELVRRLVLLGSPGRDAVPPVKQAALLVKAAGSDPAQWPRAALPNARVIELAAADPLETQPEDLAGRIASFLQG